MSCADAAKQLIAISEKKKLTNSANMGSQFSDAG
jgi:hypothetical protein